jgi:hypothetical protein
MDAVGEADILRAAFAVSVVLAAIVIAGAALNRISLRVVYRVDVLIAAGATIGWALFALDPRTELAVPAAGLTASLLAAVAAIGVRRGVLHAQVIGGEVKKAEARLEAIVARDAEERAAELERVLARARAESLSLISDEERRIVESRRAMIAEREQAATRELRDALAETQRRVEQRLAEWGEDLERAQGNLFDRLQGLAGRQRRLIEEAV